MRITIKEAMQLKNEVATAINASRQPSFLLERLEGMFGTLTINDEVQTPPNNVRTFPEAYQRIENLFRVNQALHLALAKANVEHDIGDAIRRRENVKQLIAANELALRHAKPYSRTDTRNIAGTGLERAVTVYEPFVLSGELKGRIRALKRELRELQAHIDAANTSAIDIPNLEIDEVEVLIVD